MNLAIKWDNSWWSKDASKLEENIERWLEHPHSGKAPHLGHVWFMIGIGFKNRLTNHAKIFCSLLKQNSELTIETFQILMEDFG